MLEPSLSQIILVKNFPRSLIQIVLQIESAPVNDYVNNKIVQAGIVSSYPNSQNIPAPEGEMKKKEGKKTGLAPGGC